MKDLYTQPKIGIRYDEFDKPPGAISIPLDCNSYLGQKTEQHEENSEYN
jgi:hypothetical protein